MDIYTTMQEGVLAQHQAREMERLRESNAELLGACRAQHKALDLLLAELVEVVPGFMPSESVAWGAVVKGYEAITKAGGEAV